MDSMLQLCLGCVVVSAIWGCTNPFLRMGFASSTTPPQFSGLLGRVESVVRVLLNWRFSLPFIVNQLGSIANNVLIGSAPISLVAPITNALTFVFTAFTAYLLGERQACGWRTIAGTMLIIAGLSLCLLSGSS